METVKFSGRFREGEYSQCDCCTAIGRIAVVEIPITRYTKESNYKEMGTHNRMIWMCDDCRMALTRLLNRLEDKANAE